MSKILWRIYYDGGSTYDSSMGAPHEAPPEGVLCVVFFDRHGKRFIGSMQPFYCFDVETQEWWPLDLAGLFDRLRRNLVYAYKEGRSVDNEKFEVAMRRADQDPDFPVG